jgi:hypothetical protein
MQNVRGIVRARIVRELLETFLYMCLPWPFPARVKLEQAVVRPKHLLGRELWLPANFDVSSFGLFHVVILNDAMVIGNDNVP